MSLTNAGTFSVQVSNLTGKVSAPFNLGVVDTSVHNLFVVAGTTLTMQASAAGPGITYQWLKNGRALQDDTVAPLRITGSRTSRLVIRNLATTDADVYTCLVTVGTASLSTGAWNLTVRIKPLVDNFTISPTIVSGTVSIPVPMIVPGLGIDGVPTRVIVSGLPPGLVYDPVSNRIIGQPTVGGTTYTFKITPLNGAGTGQTVERTIYINPLPTAAVGAFNGLVDRDPAGNNGHGGTLSLVSKATGAFTGRLSLGASAWAISGRLNATVGGNPTATAVINRGAKLSLLHVNFTIDQATGHLTGTVDDTTPTFTTALEAWRNPFSATHPATGLAATYNAWMNAPADSTSSVPQGASYGTLVINTLGAAVWSGTLADGTATTRTTTVGPNGDVPLAFMLYASTGSFLGWLNAAPAAGGNTLGGSLTWLKNAQPATSTTRSYKGGFTPCLALSVTGGQYLKPAAGTILWGLTNVSTGSSNALLTFNDGGISLAANEPDLNGLPLRLLAANGVQIPLPNPTVLKLAVNASTGRFSGSAVLKDGAPKVVSRVMTFSGIIVSSQAKGRGFFTLPQLPNISTSPVLSGSVELDASSASQ